MVGCYGINNPNRSIIIDYFSQCQAGKPLEINVFQERYTNAQGAWV